MSGNQSNRLRYLGTHQNKEPYLPNGEMVEAVNLAIFLERPLLLRGEPGSGKSRLAHAIAGELNLPLEVWSIKSTSEAREGLYTYDHIGRLRDAQLAVSCQQLGKDPQEYLKEKEKYTHYGPIGRAFHNKKRTVVLIDEIDKADVNFPNDLLDILEKSSVNNKRSFSVLETGEEITCQEAPIIIITSNHEKELPDAFLRRCLFHYVEFPNIERLQEIVELHLGKDVEGLLQLVLERFYAVRKQMDNRTGAPAKKVGTSELLDWYKALKERIEVDDPKTAVKDPSRLPLPSTLIKRTEDRHLASGNSDSET